MLDLSFPWLRQRQVAERIVAAKDLLFRAEYKPRVYYLEHFWQADMGYIGHAIIGVKAPNSSHVASIQHGRVVIHLNNPL